MGILNVTPDSFSDKGKFFEHTAAVDRGWQIAEQGADILDIGGESTRPGSQSVAVDEELRRVIPILEALASGRKYPIPISSRHIQSGSCKSGTGSGGLHNQRHQLASEGSRHRNGNRQAGSGLGVNAHARRARHHAGNSTE